MYYNESNDEWAFMVFSEGKNNSSWVEVSSDGSIATNAYQGKGVYSIKEFRKMKKDMKRTTGNPYYKYGRGTEDIDTELLEHFISLFEDPLSFPGTPGIGSLLVKWQKHLRKKEQQKRDKKQEEESQESQEKEETKNNTQDNTTSDSYNYYPSYDQSMSPSERDYRQMLQDLKNW